MNLAAFELHEDKIPELRKCVSRTINVRGTVLRVVRIGAHVIVNLAARAARSGLAHLPEIIFAAEAQNPFSRRTYLLPEFFCVFIRADFVISFENSEPHACRVEPVFI